VSDYHGNAPEGHRIEYQEGAEVDLEQFREFIRTHTEELKHIAEHPEIVDDWTAAEQAWFLEHLEHNKALLEDLQSRLNELLRGRKA
jgi:hypothetical protein